MRTADTDLRTRTRAPGGGSHQDHLEGSSMPLVHATGIGIRRRGVWCVDGGTSSAWVGGGNLERGLFTLKILDFSL